MASKMIHRFNATDPRASAGMAGPVIRKFEERGDAEPVGPEQRSAVDIKQSAPNRERAPAAPSTSKR